MSPTREGNNKAGPLRYPVMCVGSPHIRTSEEVSIVDPDLQKRAM